MIVTMYSIRFRCREVCNRIDRYDERVCVHVCVLCCRPIFSGHHSTPFRVYMYIYMYVY